MSDVDPARLPLERLWNALGAAPLPALHFVGEAGGLPSVYAVDVLATASVGLATAAVAELHATRRNEEMAAVEVDRRHAAIAFRSERYLAPIGWSVPPAWDPIAGDYPTRDGWIRLHTNYRYHRSAALRALGVVEDRDAVARAVRGWERDALESAIVAEGGAAAAMRSVAEWKAHPQGLAVAAEPTFLVTETGTSDARPLPPPGPAPQALPLAGIRVLDLTRVIAGPVCTSVLAAYGADVLRLDPPAFEEVAALLPETTAGKRCATLDLRSSEGKAVFASLVADADLLVCGYHADALERLGLGTVQLRALNPALSIVLLDAYGWSGPWRDRRGFDSLVQMSTGIAERGQLAVGAAKPTPLPAQALDHGAGYWLAGAACRALTERHRARRVTTTRISLARVAAFLEGLGANGDPAAAEIADVGPWRERVDSAFGPLERVRSPGRIVGIASRREIPAGPLGRAAPTWVDR